MQLVNFHYFYTLAKSLQGLNRLRSDAPIIENWSELYDAEMALRAFLGNTILPPDASTESGQALVASIDSLTSNASRPERVKNYEVYNIQNHLKVFENVLEAEYRIKTVFALSRKGLYSLNDLAYRGETMFSEIVHKLMPDIRKDLHEAGRCIAFEVPTAASFHLFRATEAAVKSYIHAVRGRAVTEKEKNLGLGGYVKILDELGIDARILSSLRQLYKLHRNPTIHPEVHVTNEEALAALGMVESAIRIVAIDMERREKTPDTSLDDFLPLAADESESREGTLGLTATAIAGQIPQKRLSSSKKVSSSKREPK